MLRKLPMLRSISSVALRMRSRDAFLEPWALAALRIPCKNKHRG